MIIRNELVRIIRSRSEGLKFTTNVSRKLRLFLFLQQLEGITHHTYAVPR
jgi:hypothetical protein